MLNYQRVSSCVLWNDVKWPRATNSILDPLWTTPCCPSQDTWNGRRTSDHSDGRCTRRLAKTSSKSFSPCCMKRVLNMCVLFKKMLLCGCIIYMYTYVYFFACANAEYPYILAQWFWLANALLFFFGGAELTHVKITQQHEGLVHGAPVLGLWWWWWLWWWWLWMWPKMPQPAGKTCRQRISKGGCVRKGVYHDIPWYIPKSI